MVAYLKWEDGVEPITSIKEMVCGYPSSERPPLRSAYFMCEGKQSSLHTRLSLLDRLGSPHTVSPPDCPFCQRPHCFSAQTARLDLVFPVPSQNDLGSGGLCKVFDFRPISPRAWLQVLGSKFFFTPDHGKKYSVAQNHLGGWHLSWS